MIWVTKTYMELSWDKLAVVLFSAILQLLHEHIPFILTVSISGGIIVFSSVTLKLTEQWNNIY